MLKTACKSMHLGLTHSVLLYIVFSHIAYNNIIVIT